MNYSKKITIVTFAPVSINSTGPGKFVLQLGRVLQENDCLHAIICPSFVSEGSGLSDSVLVTPPSTFFLKVVYKLLTLVSKITGIKIRRYREMIFDYFVSRSNTLKKSEIVIFTKPIFKKSARYCLAQNINTLAFASVLHPRFNNDMVKNEMARLGVNEYSEYADDERTDYLSDFFMTINNLLVQSDMVKEIYVKYGVKESIITVLNSSINVDVDIYKSKVKDVKNFEDFCVLHISNMDLIKGVDYLLTAWDSGNLKNAKLVLGGMAKSGSEDVYERHNMKNVHIVGYVNDTAKLYSEADVFVSPSISDLNPYTVLEAMACGIPVIVSDHCGMSAFVEHTVDGFVYKYNDTDELQSYLSWCCSNRDDLREMGKNARKKAMNISKNNIAKNIYQYIDELER